MSAHLVRLALLSAAMSAFALPAAAQVDVLGGQMTGLCVAAAKSVRHDPEAVHICSIAIESEAATGRNLAGLYVNRGVLELRDRGLVPARRDFDTAISIDPGMGEAWVNRGADLIAEKRWQAGVADIDHGLSLGPEEPEKAYFNRAIAREHLDDVKGAYLDYKKAVELAPLWPAPQEELKRFTVSPKQGT